MRIAVYLDTGGPLSGGGHTYVDTIISELADRIGETKHTMVLFRFGSIEKAGRRAKPGVECHRIPWASVTGIALLLDALLRRLSGHPFWGLSRSVRYVLQQRLAQRLRKWDVKLLWSFKPHIYTFEIPYVITIWDLQHRNQGYFPEVSCGGEWLAREQSLSEAIRRSVYVIASNEVGKREIEVFYQMPPGRVISLPHFPPRWAIESSDREPRDLCQRFGLTPHGYILYPAQFWPHKNHIRILEALTVLKNRGSRKIKAVFVGSDHGNKEFVVRRTAELGLSDQVCFPGFVPSSELAWLYRHAHSLVYASMFGPENLPPLEAFVFGCPVICANYDGAVEQFADAALYFEPTNPEDLADKIILLESDGLREQLCQTGKRRSQLWTARHYVERIFSLLDDFEAVRRCWP